ncbi:MAG: thioredoxin family protein [Candidatus Obscuribacterales bacterium]|jgi:thiol-disulfide isomerase/thioredoxin
MNSTKKSKGTLLFSLCLTSASLVSLVSVASLATFATLATSAVASPAHAAVQEVTVPQLLNMVRGSGPIVVEFYDSTDIDAAGECAKQKPIFEKVAADYAGKATFVRMDISKATTFAESGRFTVCPSHLFLDHNKPEPNRISKRHWGYLSERDFQELLKEYFNVQ